MIYDQQLGPEQLAQLVGGGECFIHFHPKEQLDFSDRLELMAATPVNTVTGNYTPTKADEIILADTTNNNITITLPLAANGREFQIVKYAPQNILYIVPTPPNLILGSALGLQIFNVYTSMHLKSITSETPNEYIAL